MNVNGIGAGYPAAGYETRRTERNVAWGNFADAINKAATKKETNAFRPESSDEVMRAWDKALAETGVNPFSMNRISTALVLHVENGQQGLSSTFLGDWTENLTVPHGTCGHSDHVKCLHPFEIWWRGKGSEGVGEKAVRRVRRGHEVLPLERVEKRPFYFFFTLFGGQNMLACGKIYVVTCFWGHGENLENMGKNQDIPRYKELWELW